MSLPLGISKTSAFVMLCFAVSLSLWIDTFEVRVFLALMVLAVVLLIFIDNPGPGAGVGKPAAALPGLRLVASCDKSPQLPPLSAKGMPLQGHAYLIVFFNTRRACLRAAVKADAFSRMLQGAGATSWFHTVLVSRDGLDELEAATRHWPKRATAVAHDVTQQASADYISVHRAYAQPHAFLIDQSGIIAWHGQINRPALREQCAMLLSARLQHQGMPASRTDKIH